MADNSLIWETIGNVRDHTRDACVQGKFLISVLPPHSLFCLIFIFGGRELGSHLVLLKDDSWLSGVTEESL